MTNAPASQTPGPAALALRNRTRVKVVAAIIAIAALVVLLCFVPSDSGQAKAFAITAGALVLVKELFSAFARDDGAKLDKKWMEDLAAIASLFAVVFGVPAVVGSIF